MLMGLFGAMLDLIPFCRSKTKPYLGVCYSFCLVADYLEYEHLDSESHVQIFLAALIKAPQSPKLLWIPVHLLYFLHLSASLFKHQPSGLLSRCQSAVFKL